jgi:hypothetical protein
MCIGILPTSRRVGGIPMGGSERGREESLTQRRGGAEGGGEHVGWHTKLIF